jgi:hypothetical protein
MRELPVLEQDGVLSLEKTDQIRAYYAANTRSGLHWAVVAFAILGALLIGSGIILLFAHNWESFTRPARAVLSFCPLAIGALLSLTALLRNGGSAWREGAGLFHALAAGASIALIGQTYHLPGDTPAFLLTWALLILPLPFLLRATGPLLVYLGLACGWTAAAQDAYGQAAAFWLLLLPAAARLAHLLSTHHSGTQAQVTLAGLLTALCVGTGLAFTRNREPADGPGSRPCRRTPSTLRDGTLTRPAESAARTRAGTFALERPPTDWRKGIQQQEKRKNHERSAERLDDAVAVCIRFLFRNERGVCGGNHRPPSGDRRGTLAATDTGTHRDSGRPDRPELNDPHR